MDKIINWLLLVIIFVFDPLAISLVVAANFAFAQAFPKREDEETLHTDSIWTDIEDRISEDDDEGHYDAYVDRQAPEEEDPQEEWDEEHALDQVLNNMVEDLDEDDFLDKTPLKSTKPTMDISVNHEDAEKWNQLADELARGTVEMQEDEEHENAWLDDPDVQDFLERADEQGPWSEEDDKINTIGGLTNDPEGSFMDFQNQMDANDTRDIEVIDPEEVSNKWEVEDTSGNVTVHEESDSEFPNENNPTSVAATVAEIQNKFGTYPSTVEKLETPHLPKTETTTVAPTVKKVVKKSVSAVKPETPTEIDEDELFDEAMRLKAEQDKQEFLRNNENSKK